MNSLRKLYVLIMCVCALCMVFTSCLSDDDDNNNTVKTLSAAEKAAQLSAMRGNYDGYIHFMNDTTAKEDSLFAMCSVADSTLTVKVPIQVFANGVNNNDAYKLLSTAVGTTDVNGYIYPYYNNVDDSSIYSFSFIPHNGKVTFTVTKDDKTHEVTATFATQMNNYYGVHYSIGQYVNPRMATYLLLYSVTIDGSTYLCGRTTYFVGTKH